MSRFHIAQINLARMRAPMESELMSGFAGRLDEINALADGSPGFVWRLKSSEGGNATDLRLYDDDRVIVNMSVWESVEALKDFTYRTAHAELLRQRKEWFENFESVFLAMWWVPAGHVPGFAEARQRIDHLEEHGPSQFAFTFRTIQPPDESFLASLDWPASQPCPAT
jgi:uncharacterized protein DUF3291